MVLAFPTSDDRAGLVHCDPSTLKALPSRTTSLPCEVAQVDRDVRRFFHIVLHERAEFLVLSSQPKLTSSTCLSLSCRRSPRMHAAPPTCGLHELREVHRFLTCASRSHEDGRNRAHENLLDSRRGMQHELTSCGSETAKSEDPEFAKLRAGGLPHQTARHRFSRYLPQQ